MSGKTSKSPTVVKNPFYVAKDDDGLSESLSGEEGQRVEVVLSPKSGDAEEKLRNPIIQIVSDFWVLISSPVNAIAGLAAAMHVNIYLLSLALILSTPYFNAMATLQVAVLGTIVLQLVQSVLSPYRSFAICHADSVPAAVMVQVIATAMEKTEMNHYESQEQAKALWEIGQNITLAPDMEDCLSGLADDMELCYEYEECYNDPVCKARAHSTIFVAIIVGNVFVALMLAILGSGHAARVIAFVPATVQAAFLAGVGFKIFKMGVTFMVTKSEIKQLLTFGLYKGKAASHRRMLSGDEEQSGGMVGVFINFGLVVFLAILINLVEVKMHHSKISKWLWPLMMLGLTAVFYIFLGIYAAAAGKDYLEAYGDAQSPSRNNSYFPELPRDMGWLMNDAHSNTDSIFPQYDGFVSDIYYGAVFNTTQLANYILLVVITVLAILLNTVAIEEESGLEIDFDKELRTVALGNFMAASLGGFTGYASSAKTLLCHSMGGEHYAGLWSAAYFAAFVFFGKYLAAIIPIPVIGGFIAAIGIELMVEWLWHMRHKLATSELYELMFLFLMMTYNFIGGFVFGMLLSLLSFTARYMQTPVVKSVVDANNYGGIAMRGWKERTMLLRYGSEVCLMRLQGFIFFATAERLRQTIVDLLVAKKKRGCPVRFLVIDFKAVENIDTTAAKKFKKVLQFTRDEGIAVVLTAVPPTAKAQLDQDHVNKAEFPNMDIMDDIDQGMDYCCDQVLATEGRRVNFVKRGPDGKFTFAGIVRGIVMMFHVGMGRIAEGEKFDSPSFREAGTLKVFNKGALIASQQEYYTPGNELYFIAKGSCVKVHVGKYGNRRVEKRYRGTIVGELAFFLKQPRSEDLYADEDNTEVYSFTKHGLDKLHRKYPHLEEHLMTHCMERMSESIKKLKHQNHLLEMKSGLNTVMHSSDEDDVDPDEKVGDTELAARLLEESSPYSQTTAQKRMKGIGDEESPK